MSSQNYENAILRYPTALDENNEKHMFLKTYLKVQFQILKPKIEVCDRPNRLFITPGEFSAANAFEELTTIWLNDLILPVAIETREKREAEQNPEISVSSTSITFVADGFVYFNVFPLSSSTIGNGRYLFSYTHKMEL